MDEAIILTIKQLFEYGILGLVATLGWALAGWLLWRDHQKKEDSSESSKRKNEVLRQKDTELAELRKELTSSVKDLSEKRLQDVRETIGDYNQLATSTIQTLDKLTAALEVIKHR